MRVGRVAFLEALADALLARLAPAGAVPIEWPVAELNDLSEDELETLLERKLGET